MRIGTRGSALALAQAETVARRIAGAELVEVRTDDGAVGDKARFVRGLEKALLDERIDLAVHSAKDLPGKLPEGLELVGVPEREDARDAFCGAASALEEIPEGGRIGTSSLRRRAQLLALRPDVEVVELRGNVDTRLRKLHDESLDGVVLAMAGLRRLGRDEEASFVFETDRMTPAPGQGTLALEGRTDDEDSAGAAARLNEPTALAELLAERAAVRELTASCHTPVGIRAMAQGGLLAVEGFAGLPDGSEWIRDRIEADVADPSAAGTELARRMVAVGAADLLERAEAMVA